MNERGGDIYDLYTGERATPENTPTWTTEGEIAGDFSVGVGDDWYWPNSSNAGHPTDITGNGISCVFRFRTVTSGLSQYALGKYSGLPQYYFGLNNATGTNLLYLRYGSANQSFSNLTPTTNAWVTAVLVCSSAGSFGWMKEDGGPLLSQGPLTGASSTTYRNGDTTVGARTGGAADWEGQISHVRLYDRVLAASEVHSFFTEGLYAEWRRPLPVWLSSGAAPAATYQGISIVGLPV